MEKGFYVDEYGTKAKVVDVYESFSGWYWFITEKLEKDVWFGLVRGFELEWGDIYVPELEEQIRKGTVWKVPKKNWSVCPIIKSG